MSTSSNNKNHHQNLRRVSLVALLLAAVALASFVLYRKQTPSPSTTPSANNHQSAEPSDPSHPLLGRKLYVDTSRNVNKSAAQYKKKGDATNAALLESVANQPSATWLTGPTAGDPRANRDLTTVTRTSKEAAKQQATPVYVLYAIPKRDACAAHSKGGFANNTDYLAWIDKVLGSIQTKAIIIIEPDAVAHTINSRCMTPQQIADRYALLQHATQRAKQSTNVLVAYLDAGHPDWLPNPSALVDALRKSGIDNVRGISANISFFAKTQDVVQWSQQLIGLLGGNKGAVIDTGRNGKGIANAQGEARWCNPSGRGLGPQPAANPGPENIDAYLWVKTIGESDGACFGKPPAGTFVPELAIELARNATP
jgi:endoglucanase